MKSILDNCVALQQVWDESLDGNLEPEIKGRIVGVKSQINTFNYFYGVIILLLVLTQLQILKTKFINSNEKTVSAVINYMKTNIVQTDFYSEIIILLKLYLVSPAMNVVSERPVYSMRRIKNWQGSTISEERLNHCMLLSVHKEKTDEIILKNVAIVFCKANEERRRTFWYLL